MDSQRLVRVGVHNSRDLVGEVGRQPTRDPHVRQFVGLDLRVALQFAALFRHLGGDLLGLCPYRGVFAQGHRDRAGDQAGEPRDDDRVRSGAAATDAGDQADVGDQPVHGTEHRRSQPTAGYVAVVMLRDRAGVGGLTAR